jgi:hypothetical protein
MAAYYTSILFLTWVILFSNSLSVSVGVSFITKGWDFIKSVASLIAFLRTKLLLSCNLPITKGKICLRCFRESELDLIIVQGEHRVKRGYERVTLRA